MTFGFKGNTWSRHPEYDKGFEAGQKSKQAEIDLLREMVKKLIGNTVLSIDDELEDKANNLLRGN